MIDVTIVNPQGVLFEGKANRIVLPGELGVFEVLPYHKELISRLFTGNITVDNKSFPIKRGIAKVEKENVSVVIES